MKAQESYLAGVIYSTCRVDLSRYPGSGRYSGIRADSRGFTPHTGQKVRGHEHGRVGAQMPRHVDGRVRGTDVAQGSLALDIRTWHMGPLALDVWDVAKRGDPGI